MTLPLTPSLPHVDVLRFALDDETVIRRRTEGGSFDEDQLSKEARRIPSLAALNQIGILTITSIPKCQIRNARTYRA